MKQRVLLNAFWLLILLTTYLLPTNVLAHAPGMQPFFKINNTLAVQYPISTTNLVGVQLPQDLSPESYLVNTPVNFEIDTTKLPYPPDVLVGMEFFWDFGDGVETKGLKKTHSYKKVGTYFSTIKTRYNSADEPQLIQSTLIYVVPTKDYKLPVAQIKVNGNQVKDPIKEIIKLDFSQSVNLDGSASTAETAPIATYSWDLGNKETAEGQKQSYLFSTSLAKFVPRLRVTDQNGLYTDTFVQLENTNFVQPPTQVTTQALKPDSKQPLWLLLMLVLILAAAPLIWKRFHKK